MFPSGQQGGCTKPLWAAVWEVEAVEVSGRAGGAAEILGEIPGCTLTPSLLGGFILCNSIWSGFRAGWSTSCVGKKEGATIMEELCAIAQGFGAGSSGKDRDWHREGTLWCVSFIFLSPEEFGNTEAPEHPAGMCGLMLITSKVGMAPVTVGLDVTHTRSE